MSSWQGLGNYLATVDSGLQREVDDIMRVPITAADAEDVHNQIKAVQLQIELIVVLMKVAPTA